MYTIMNVCVIAVLFLFLPKDSLQGPHEKRLINDLLDGYQSLERPVADESEPIVIHLGITLQQIIDVNEKEENLVSSCWLDFTWIDDNLKWDPAKYGNVSSVRIHPKYLWTPDVLMYNSADETFDGTYQTNIIVYSSGETSYIPPGMFKSSCKIDIRWFPFDTQECIMKFGSWTYDGTKLDLRLKADAGDTAVYTPNGEWNLKGFPATRNVEYYECCPDAPYIDLKYKFILQRRKLYYMINLIIPALLLSFMTLITFLIPPDAGEKISFAVTILLALSVFLLMVAEQLPSTSDAVPLLAQYFGIVMMFCAISVLTSVYVLNLHHRNADTHDMPRWIKRGICEWLAWMLRMKRPGVELSRAALMGKDKAKDMEMQYNDKYSKSLLTNVLDLDDESQVMANSHFTGVKMNGQQNSCPARYEMFAILKELRKITEKMENDAETEEVCADWKFAAVVVDRFLVILFTILCIVSSCGILLSAPM